jgi:hypothetical protein
MGFDEIFEVSRAAEIVSEATRKLIKEKHPPLPIISSACPAIVRLIRVRFPSLCDKVLRLQAPMHVAARMAKEEASEKTGLPFEKIGVFFLSPCPAKVTDAVQPIGVEQSYVDASFSIADLYPKLLEKMNKIETPKPIAKSGIIGVSWASTGGESSALIRENYLAADGIENVIAVLEELEDNRLFSLEFAELGACPGGCVGGVLAVENAYVAKARIQRLRKYLPVSLNHLADIGEADLSWDSRLEYKPVLELSSDVSVAMEMMEKIDALNEALPGLDCGSCGAPSCHALAEDIVRQRARRNDCIFILRQQAQDAGIHVSSGLMSPGSGN